MKRKEMADDLKMKQGGTFRAREDQSSGRGSAPTLLVPTAHSAETPESMVFFGRNRGQK